MGERGEGGIQKKEVSVGKETKEIGRFVPEGEAGELPVGRSWASGIFNDEMGKEEESEKEG